VKEAPPPRREDREPVVSEIRDGLRLVRHDPVLRAFVLAQMSLSALWGIFGATWLLFVLNELTIGPAAIGVIAGVGGLASLVGAVAATRATRRWGIGPVAIAALVVAAVGNAFIPLAPAGLPLAAAGSLIVAQLVGDSAVTVYEVTEVSVRQALVRDRALGRVASTFHVASGVVQLTATLTAGVLAGVIGLRTTMWLAPFGGVLGAAVLWFSPVRRLVGLPARAEGEVPIDPVAIAVATEKEQPPGA
jgi:predicted MFS family arabinose efflux permease